MMMNSSGPILVATDLSARSDRAIDRATMLAEHYDCRLIVLHAVTPGSRLAAMPQEAENWIRAALPPTTAAVDLVPAMGSAPAMILRAAAAAQCRLIVTGVARYNDLGDFIIGTAVDHVVRDASSPVLVVKQRPLRPYRTMLVATDFSEGSRSALIIAAELFADVAIHLLHAYHLPYEGWVKSDAARQDVAAEVQSECDAFLLHPSLSEALRKRIIVHLDYGPCHAVVADTAGHVAADLIVLGTHGAGGFIPAFIGSMAEALLRLSPVDTLMVGAQA